MSGLERKKTAELLGRKPNVRRTNSGTADADPKQGRSLHAKRDHRATWAVLRRLSKIEAGGRRRVRQPRALLFSQEYRERLGSGTLWSPRSWQTESHRYSTISTACSWCSTNCSEFKKKKKRSSWCNERRSSKSSPRNLFRGPNSI